MSENQEPGSGQNAGAALPITDKNNTDLKQTGSFVKQSIKVVSSAGAKALHYAAEMSKTKWFAVVAIAIIGLVLAKLSCQGYHPAESTGPIEVRNSDNILLLKIDANGKTLESIYPEREVDQ